MCLKKGSTKTKKKRGQKMLVNYLIGKNLVGYRKKSNQNGCVYVGVGIDKRVGHKVIKIGKFENSYSKRFSKNDYQKHFVNFQVKAIFEFDSKEDAAKMEMYNIYKLIGKGLKYYHNDRFGYKEDMYLKLYYSDRKFMTISL